MGARREAEMYLSEAKKSETPKWILIGTGVLGLLATGLVLVVRYHEINKARAEAEQARISADRARVEAERSKVGEQPKPQIAPPLPMAPLPQPAPPVVEVRPAADPPVSKQPAPDPVVGKWVERRPGAPAGDRLRTFRADGTLSLYMPKAQRTINGTWRREGNRVYFSHPSTDGIEPPTKDKWFTVVSITGDELVLLMVGVRQYTWFRSS